MDTSRQLIDSGRRARLEDRPTDAHVAFAQAVVCARQERNQRALVEALKGLGQIERDAGRGDAARPLYEEAVELSRGLDDALLLAHTVRHLGDIHQDAGRLDDAEPCYREAEALYRADKRTQTLDFANALRPLAILQELRCKKAEALALWRETRDLYAAAGIVEGVSESERHLRVLRG